MRIKLKAYDHNLVDQSAARIVEMVEDAAQKKGEAQRTISIFAKYYTYARY